jgi:malate dehydrogenase
MVDAVLKDRKKVLPCCAYLEGEFGARDVYAGVPVVLGAGGVERVFEVELNPSEREAFERSVASVRELLKIVGL